VECKTRVIPVITGATGTISRSFRKYVSDIPGIGATMYPLGTWFVLGICVWLPCIKETMMQ